MREQFPKPHCCGIFIRSPSVVGHCSLTHFATGLSHFGSRLPHASGNHRMNPTPTDGFLPEKLRSLGSFGSGILWNSRKHLANHKLVQLAPAATHQQVSQNSFKHPTLHRVEHQRWWQNWTCIRLQAHLGSIEMTYSLLLIVSVPTKLYLKAADENLETSRIFTFVTCLEFCSKSWKIYCYWLCKPSMNYTCKIAKDPRYVAEVSYVLPQPFFSASASG